MKMSNSVSIVIPNWNGKVKMEKNLPEVLKVEGVDEIIVVDDGSTDGSVKFIRDNFPKIKLVEMEVNHGFSSAVNKGTEEAKGEFVFLLNSDAVPEEGCLEYILPHFEDKRVFSVGLASGGYWSWARFDKGFFWHYQSDEKPVVAHQTLWVSGGSGVFRKDVWEKLGGLDELFNPFYEEDVDLGYRAVKRGYLNIFEPNARVEHEKNTGVISENFSKNRILKIAQRNQLFFIWKNITSEKLIQEHKLALVMKLLGNPKYWLVFIPALMRLGQINEKRKLEKKEEILRDEEILGKFR